MIVQILFGLTLGICLMITLSACLVKNVSGKINMVKYPTERNLYFLAYSKREEWNDDPPSYDSIDFSKTELPSYDDIRNMQ